MLPSANTIVLRRKYGRHSLARNAIPRLIGGGSTLDDSFAPLCCAVRGGPAVDYAAKRLRTAWQAWAHRILPDQLDCDQVVAGKQLAVLQQSDNGLSTVGVRSCWFAAKPRWAFALRLGPTVCGV